MMTALEKFEDQLRAGKVYRREDLSRLSNAVDRHLKELSSQGKLRKLAAGLYYRPRKTVFGEAPPTDVELVGAFLRDDRFLLTSPNAYNALGLGTTQLYNDTIVYNHKRHGHFKLGSRKFDFRVKPAFPKSVSREFLWVELVNNLDSVVEDATQVMVRLKEKVPELNQHLLRKAVKAYGSMRTRKIFEKTFSNDQVGGHAY